MCVWNDSVEGRAVTTLESRRSMRNCRQPLLTALGRCLFLMNLHLLNIDYFFLLFSIQRSW